MRTGRVTEVSSYTHLDSFQGLVIEYELVDDALGGSTSRVQAFVQPRSSYRVISAVGPIARLKFIEVRRTRVDLGGSRWVAVGRGGSRPPETRVTIATSSHELVSLCGTKCNLVF